MNNEIHFKKIQKDYSSNSISNNFEQSNNIESLIDTQSNDSNKEEFIKQKPKNNILLLDRMK